MPRMVGRCIVGCGVAAAADQAKKLEKKTDAGLVGFRVDGSRDVHDAVV